MYEPQCLGRIEREWNGMHVLAGGDTEEVDVVASKTKDTCSMGRSPASSRFSIVIGKLENKSEMPDSMLGELRSRM